MLGCSQAAATRSEVFLSKRHVEGKRREVHGVSTVEKEKDFSELDEGKLLSAEEAT